MSIFPKRTIQGKTVTIHWSIGLLSTGDTPLFPYFKLGVKKPTGDTTYLFEKNIQLLPEQYISGENIEHPKKIKSNNENNLARNTPILILADYLSGKHKREKLVEILDRIHASRHFYFTYTLPEDAPLGKYELVSELYIEGVSHKSVTAEDDFFYVEKITVEKNGNEAFKVNNISSESCPVKVIEYTSNGPVARLYNIPPLDSLSLKTGSDIAYLMYNEERESIPLFKSQPHRILRNQTLQSFEKKEGDSLKIYVIFPENDDAFILEGNHAKIWKMANGTIEAETIKSVDQEAYTSMLNADLLYKL